jgi:hypothetical protein
MNATTVAVELTKPSFRLARGGERRAGLSADGGWRLSNKPDSPELIVLPEKI